MLVDRNYRIVVELQVQWVESSDWAVGRNFVAQVVAVQRASAPEVETAAFVAVGRIVVGVARVERILPSKS